MITITSQPFLSWSKNPIPVSLQSDAYLDNAGSPAVAVITFAAVSNGDTIPLVWSGGKVTFTIVSSPNGTGVQLPHGDGSAAYVTTLVPFFKDNYYIDRDFYVTQVVDGLGALLPGIVLTAKSTGVIYNITPVTTGDQTVALTTGVNTAKKPNFAQLLQVWLAGSPDRQIYSSSLSLDFPETGVTTKDLSEILHTYLDYDLPDLSLVWQLCTKSFAEYYLKYAEVFGDTPVVQKLSRTASAFVYLGGYSDLALNGISAPDFLQTSLMPNPTLIQFQRWFESYPVDNFVIRTNMPQLLYFVNNRSVPETLDIRIDITFDFASPQTIIKSGGMLQSYNKACINCGYRALGLDTYTTTGVKHVTGYAITMIERTSGQTRSLTKSFTVDRSYQPYVRYIMYSDSAGNYKTLLLTGKSTLKSDVTSETASRFADQDTPSLGNISRFNIQSTNTDAINTGYISTDQYDALMELVLAKKAFRVFENALVPIVITSKEFEYSADGSNLNGYKLEYQLAFQETVYTASTGNLVVPELNKPQLSLNI